MMRPIRFTALLAMLTCPLAKGQGYRDPTFIPRVNVALGYSLDRGNAPPAVSNTFGTSGGFLSAGYAVRPWLTAAAEVTGGHGNRIGPLNQDLTLLTYTAGPRITLHYARFTPFAQATFGAAHASDSYFPRGTTYSTSATSFAYVFGGGLDYKLSHRFDLRPLQVQYLHTAFPNGSSDSQRHLVFGAGIVVKFGTSLWTPDPGRGRHKAHKAMHDTDRAAMAPPPPIPATPPAPAAPPPTDPVPIARPEPEVVHTPAAPEEFHRNVPDVFFAYDSATLRPEALRAIQDAAAWLQSRPEVNIEIGGYADERGSQEYNLTLGARRAEVTRQALVEAGLAGSRITTHSYGKLVQNCDAREESCSRMNRRAAFNLQP